MKKLELKISERDILIIDPWEIGRRRPRAISQGCSPLRGATLKLAALPGTSLEPIPKEARHILC